MSTPVGPLGNIPIKTAELLSQSQTFQQKVGVTTESSARNFIHSPSRIDTGDGIDYRSAFAVIGRDEDSVEYEPPDSGNIPVGGSISIVLYAPVTVTSYGESDALFADFVDGICQDLIEVQGIDTNLCIQRLRARGPYRANIEDAPDQRDYHQAVLEIDWSPIG